MSRRSDRIESVHTLLGVSVQDALALYRLANDRNANSEWNVEQAREVYAGCESDGRLPLRGLAANWKALRRKATLAWRDLPAWTFLGQIVNIIARSAPERRGWRTAWNDIGRMLRELNPECESDALLAQLRERADLLHGKAPPMPAVRIEADAEAPPLTLTEQSVLELIRNQPKGQGITGKNIVSTLGKQGHPIEQNTLTTHIIPKLKKWFGVVNPGGGRGYYIPSE